MLNLTHMPLRGSQAREVIRENALLNQSFCGVSICGVE